ncbi:hypothetical protein [Salinispira pacifica]
MSNCFSCGSSLDSLGRVYRSTLCPTCGKDVHVCLNCRFYEPGVHWDCRETISEPVRDKDRANFCDFFMLASGNRKSGQQGRPDRASNARSQFDDLFSND